MGKKQLVILILLPFLLFLLLLLSYPPIILVILDIFREKGEMIITDIFLTENSMVVEIERKGTRINFPRSSELSYRNIPREFMFTVVPSSELDRLYDLYAQNGLSIEPGLFIMQEEWHGERESKIILTMDLTGIDRAVYNENESLPYSFHTLYINEEAVLSFPPSGRRRAGADIFIEKDKVHILERYFRYP
jgi:hypothetical protein